MPIINYYITDRKNRFQPIHYYGTSIPRTLALPKAYKYLVGIDQSTTCTGIYIQDVKNTINFICDFQRMEDVGQFVDKLLFFLKKLLKDREVVLFVYEALPTNAIPNNVLEKLHKQISSWRLTEPIFAKLNPMVYDDISPSIWKSHVYLGPSKEIKNAFNTKSQIAKHICTQKPNLLPFYEKIQSKDYDAFDATGILVGYLREHFLDGVYNPLQRRIGGQTKFFDDVFVAVAKAQFSDIDVLLHDISQDLDFVIKDKNKLPFLFWNTKYTFMENIRKALTHEDIVVSIISDQKEQLCLQFRYNLEVKQNECIYILISKSKDLSKTQKTHLKNGGRFICELFK